MNRAIPAISIRLQDAIQISEEEDVHAGIRRKVLLQPKMVRLGAKFSRLQKFQRSLLTMEEVCTRLEPLYRMHDQVKIVELRARLEEVSGKTSRGAVENG